ncbi:hypothetical protein AtEden1_Chr1g0024321 [Arabidopsis thaliana]
MATQVSKKICSVLMIVILFAMMFSAHSNSIDVCVKNCVVNQCMKASKKATPAICANPCKIICDPLNNERYIVPRGNGGPIKRFCRAFSWICSA